METVRSSTPVADQRPFPDVILRSQFFEMVGKRALSSEQRLMLAVLADAINVVQECSGSVSLRKRSSFREAWNWIFTTGVRCPLSFDNVCDALGMNAEGLRWRLSEMVQGRGGTPMRLRLKEASRMQRLTVNRVRRRDPRRVRRPTRPR
ncbi:MAG: hypothetical protein Q7S58_11345 [Candidatus Binatus sp.]|uniref:hypothetical protein n=1 Tax=Candidatus Binatus sp. TaxID=2811406 RepID=UPI002726EB67|nr:hypothetical protein [Candidatus Binatus sp.]MDO8432991.1 hypothetical protein [Candidatus Binatus sp.]